VDGVSQVAGDLLHPSLVRFVNNARELAAPTGQVNHEQHVVPNQACECHDLDGEEIHGSDGAQCARRNALHDERLFRAGAGSMPASSRMRLIVLRPRL
jgi:hypothetical protein